MPNVTAWGPLADRRLLELVGDVCGMLDLEELRHGLLAALHRVLPSDYVSLNDIGPSPDQIVTIMQPDAPELLPRWMTFAHENPLLRRYLRTLDGRAYRFSDVISPEELHELPLYHAVYAPLGVEHQIAFNLPASPERVLAVALSRKRSDYSDAERDFANRARPFLIQAYLNAIAVHELRGRGADSGTPMLERLHAAGLTSREAQVMRLVALGRSNNHVGAELQISPRTVGKHLEHGFRKLGVADRSTAARRVWQLAGSSPDDSAVDAPQHEPLPLGGPSSSAWAPRTGGSG
ncbi:MAG TPA: helix-turn-helix transcriptional regulator [Solirubrobacteraceae bacterium]|jgi:DNA-binding CsgD family transcriptional regulator|nr:helix-turn-helix transcriptional regulator [Solirubrobacteraceae bacterium]